MKGHRFVFAVLAAVILFTLPMQGLPTASAAPRAGPQWPPVIRTIARRTVKEVNGLVQQLGGRPPIRYRVIEQELLRAGFREETWVVHNVPSGSMVLHYFTKVQAQVFSPTIWFVPAAVIHQFLYPVRQWRYST